LSFAARQSKARWFRGRASSLALRQCLAHAGFASLTAPQGRPDRPSQSGRLAQTSEVCPAPLRHAPVATTRSGCWRAFSARRRGAEAPRARRPASGPACGCKPLSASPARMSSAPVVAGKAGVFSRSCRVLPGDQRLCARSSSPPRPACTTAAGACPAIRPDIFAVRSQGHGRMAGARTVARRSPPRPLSLRAISAKSGDFWAPETAYRTEA